MGVFCDWGPSSNISHAALDLSVIAVHGLNGHAFDTWRYHEGDEYSMWLRDSLPQRFPGARIMTFGYNFVDSICALPNPLWKLAKQLLEALCFLRSLVSDMSCRGCNRLTSEIESSQTTGHPSTFNGWTCCQTGNFCSLRLFVGLM